MIAVDWTVYARLSRAEALTLRERDFVLAARVLGYSQRRIVARHVLPGRAPGHRRVRGRPTWS